MLRCLRLNPHWYSWLSNPTLVFDKEMVIQKHRHLMESHCTGHQRGMDNRTVIISGKTAEGENVSEGEFLWDIPFKLLLVVH